MCIRGVRLSRATRLHLPGGKADAHAEDQLTPARPGVVHLIVLRGHFLGGGERLIGVLTRGRRGAKDSE